MIMLLAIFYCFSFFIRRSKGRFPKEKRRKKKALRPMASGQPESYKSQRVEAERSHYALAGQPPPLASLYFLPFRIGKCCSRLVSVYGLWKLDKAGTIKHEGDVRRR